MTHVYSSDQFNLVYFSLGFTSFGTIFEWNEQQFLVKCRGVKVLTDLVKQSSQGHDLGMTLKGQMIYKIKITFNGITIDITIFKKLWIVYV